MLLRCLCGRPADFYPRPPRGGRPCALSASVAVVRFLSTPSARRATDAAVGVAAHRGISIHALREEGDPKIYYNEDVFGEISIHALREEGDVFS